MQSFFLILLGLVLLTAGLNSIAYAVVGISSIALAGFLVAK